MKLYAYVNSDLLGVLDVSDYMWCVFIEAESEEDALQWGHKVADKYDELYKLQPSGKRMSFERIVSNGEIEYDDEDEEEPIKDKNLFWCMCGEYPDFEIYLKQK